MATLGGWMGTRRALEKTSDRQINTEDALQMLENNVV